MPTGTTHVLIYEARVKLLPAMRLQQCQQVLQRSRADDG